jgi:hypothetical protein
MLSICTQAVVDGEPCREENWENWKKWGMCVGKRGERGGVTLNSALVHAWQALITQAETSC